MDLTAKTMQIYCKVPKRGRGHSPSLLNRIVHWAFLWFILTLPVAAQQNNQSLEEQYPALVRKTEFRTFTAKDGLTADYFLGNLLVDSQGYIWIGTFDGLNRFDGYKFENFRYDPNDSNSLSGSPVLAICEDYQGLIWIGTSTTGGEIGLNHFDPNTKRISRHSKELFDSTVLGGNSVNCIFEDQRHVLWIGTTNGLYQIHRSSLEPKELGRKCRLSYSRYSHDPGNRRSLSSDTVRSIREDENHDLWVRTHTGFDRLDSRTRLFEHHRQDPRVPKSLVGKTLNEVYQDRSGVLWVSTDEGLYMVREQSDKIAHFRHASNDHRSLSNDFVYTVFQDMSGVIWVGTVDGLNEFNHTTSRFLRHLHGAIVTSIVEDRAGNLWIGTNGNGLIQLTRRARQLKTFVLDGHGSSPLYVLSEEAQRIVALSLDLDTLFSLDSLGIRSTRGLDGIKIYTWLETTTGEMWFGTGGNGLVHMNKTGALASYQLHPEPSADPSLGQNSVASVCEDFQGYLWLATNDGLIRFDPKSKTVLKKFHHDPNDSSSISTNAVNTVMEDNEHLLWVATFEGGLNRFDPKTERFSHWTTVPTDTTTLNSSILHSMADGKDGSLWVGTSEGLNWFEKRTGKVLRTFRRSGNLSNYVWQILKDKTDHIWAAYSNNGFSRLDVRTGQFTTFTQRDGLLSEMFNFKGCYQRHNGEIVFQSGGGSIVFHPDSLGPGTFKPPVVISSFSVFEKSMNLVSNGLSSYKDLTMTYDSNFFSFKFAALDLSVPERNQFAYVFEGYEDAWHYIGNEREAHYTKVPPGEYVFRVKGTNSDGMWSANEASLKITILPPWWKTWWAYSGYALAFLSLLYSIRRFEINRKELKHQAEVEHVKAMKLLEIDQMKSRFFSNISHEFRTPLTLILGPIQKWKERSVERLSPVALGSATEVSPYNIDALHNDLTMMERNAHRLLRLINQLLDLSRLEAGGMKLQTAPGNIVAFVKGIAHSFESSAGRRNMSLTVKAGEEEIDVYFDRDKMEKILVNLLSNAFKFTGEGGSVRVTVERIGESLFIHVKDTGVGIPADQLEKIFDRFYQVDPSQITRRARLRREDLGGQGTGIGLALTKDLVALHYGTLSVESNVGKGTAFTIRLPLGRKHLAEEEIIDSGEFIEPTTIPGGGLIPVPRAEEAGQDHSFPHKSAPIILFIEDNADVRAYVKECFAPSYRFKEADNGEEGIAQSFSLIPDLIISDVMMPGMDGFDVCRTLKLDERTSHIPIILLTAKAGPENKIEGLETGADDYVVKPFDARELLARVRNLIENRRRLRERFGTSLITLRPDQVPVKSVDRLFLEKVKTAIETNMANEKFGVEDLAKEVAMSRAQLHRKLTALTGTSAGDVIRAFRLQRAKHLLEEHGGTIAEIAYAVGFSSPAYFTKCFQEEFGSLPSEIRKN